MAEVSAPQGEWVEIFEVSGIAVGSAVLVQNKSDGPVMVVESASAPAAGVTQGYMLAHGEPLLIAAGSPGAWAMSLSFALSLYAGEQ